MTTAADGKQVTHAATYIGDRSFESVTDATLFPLHFQNMQSNLDMIIVYVVGFSRFSNVSGHDYYVCFIKSIWEACPSLGRTVCIHMKRQYMWA